MTTMNKEQMIETFDSYYQRTRSSLKKDNWTEFVIILSGKEGGDDKEAMIACFIKNDDVADYFDEIAETARERGFKTNKADLM